ncbi:MAG: DUF4093 domain-containing protein [Clostridia bacterium]|nr:DUF4093 domain-containing protein [Clostridia bacterium]
MEKKQLALPILVEGRYDKNMISQLYFGTVITAEGFGVFNSKEKQALIRRLSAEGLIVLTDSDGGGVQIRSFIKGLVDKEKLYHLYIPKIEGRERRKRGSHSSGYLGVEGMEPSVLRGLLDPFTKEAGRVGFARMSEGGMLTKVDFFRDGLSGGANSSARRAQLALHFDLPADMTANALLAALNLVATREEYEAALAKLAWVNFT